MRDLRRASDKGTYVYYDGLLQEINGKLDARTAYEQASETLRDQAVFTLGYYHQRQDFFRKREAAAPPVDTINGTNATQGA